MEVSPKRWAVVVLAVVVAAGAAAFGLRHINLSNLGDALSSVRPGWLVVGFVLMGISLVVRGVSWLEILRAALPNARIRAATVIRATMIGVMASAALPGRLGEAARAMVVARRLGDMRGHLSIVAGTILAQTLLNLLALAVLGAIVLGSIAVLDVRTGVAVIIGVPVLIAGGIVIGPSLIRRAAPRWRVAAWLAVQLEQARSGLRVFRRGRPAAVAAVAQLTAWALQVGACYAVLQALSLHPHKELVAAAAVLLAVNVTAVVPLAPSNVGVFQAACVAVLAAFGVGASDALAYGIVLQALEVITAAALGLPALAGEGLTWAQVKEMS
jgi:phosphatidylinositol alpha-mannosyltransferase